MENEKAKLKEQCKFCKEHCGEVYHFNLAKINFELEKEIAELEKEIAELKNQIEKMKIKQQIDLYEQELKSMDFI